MTAPLPTVSVLLPVKNGGDLLDEVLAAVVSQNPHELIITDSGSTDHSVEIAERHGARVIHVPPAEFRHGPTRNLLGEASSGEVLAFLTQDATPIPGWLEAIAKDFAENPDLGVVFGPHLPRADTSAMIARELTAFFATMLNPDGSARTYAPEDPPFLSNTNSAYRRACWDEIRFADIPYAEDLAFGTAVKAHPRWQKRVDPAAAVLHAHDYPPMQFLRRYFDEYRALRETVGHLENIGPRTYWRNVRGATKADLKYVRKHKMAGGIARWAFPIVRHHTIRHVGAGLGGRSHRLPVRVESWLSLEGRASAREPRDQESDQPVVTTPVAPRPNLYGSMLEARREGAVPLAGDAAARARREHLHVAVVIPWFRIGSGGHMTIFRLIEQLERKGHTCTLWLDDPMGYNGEGPAALRGTIVEHFRPIKAPLFKGFSDWFGADVVLATGWHTAYSVQRLPNVGARAYLVQDAEPEFFAASAERRFAEDTYGLGLHGIAASPWLADMVREHGSSCGHFDLAADHDVYHPREGEREPDTVAFYARLETARRGVALGALALEEVVRRRPQTRVIAFGSHKPVPMGVPTESAGVLSSDALARLYSQSTVGLCLSLTNYSLIPGEMIACGLPAVDVNHPSAVGVFGDDGPVAFAEQDVFALADVVERLLSDPEERARRSEKGLLFAQERTWERAGNQVEAELRAALRGTTST